MNGWRMVKGVTMLVVLVLMAIQDIKERKISDKLNLILLGIGMIQIEPIDALAGLLFVPLPFFITELIKPNSVGGGDIKLMATASFCLGLHRGLIGTVLGICFALISMLISGMIKRRSIPKYFPMAPFLLFGYMIVYVI